MNTTDKTTVSNALFEALRMVQSAATDLVRTSERLAKDAANIVEDLNGGMMPRWGLSHQTPYDLWRYQAQLEAYAQMASYLCAAEEVDPGLITEAAAARGSVWAYSRLEVADTAGEEG